MTLPRTVFKGHATANDFVIYFDPDGTFDPTPSETRFVCDRHCGIGGDGLIRLTRAEFVTDLSPEQRDRLAAGGAEWFMDYRNADGSLAEMCGNGTRLTARFAQSLGLLGREVGARWLLGTRAGVKELTYRGNDAELGHDVFTVRMGGWSAGEIGAYSVSLAGAERDVSAAGGEGDGFVGISQGSVPSPRAESSARADSRTRPNARATYADLGNPHVVSVVTDASRRVSLPATSLPDVENLDLTRTPIVEPALPQGQNAEFVRIDSLPNVPNGGVGAAATRQHLGIPSFSGAATMRVNERGVGETLSCGTGLCATGIVLRKLTGVGTWAITVRGGVLRVVVTDDDVTLTGSSTLVGEVALLED